MSRSNRLLIAPPYAVDQVLRRLGHNLRQARLRRKQTIEEVAARIGTGTRLVRDAESGKASSAIGVYAALLWAYDLLQPFEELADPLTDKVGLALAEPKGDRRARKSGQLKNDF
jgi:transcriptional regulator with XRE-family HTH domain